jgi:hypothetical protein
MFTVQLTWDGGAATAAHRIYMYDTGEVPNATCVFDTAWGGGPLVETQPGATSVDVELDSAVTGSGTRCLYIVAVNAAGESSPVLAWSSD